MRNLIFTTIAFVIFLSANATNYYVAINGSDSNNGSSPLSPWKSLSKVNSMMNTLLPGDSVLFRRGDEFNGSLNMTKSGTTAKPIVFSVYGTGNALAIINGCATVSNWSRYKGNIWRAYHNNNSSNDINNVFINGIQKEIGRFPNRVGSIGTPNTNGMQGYIQAPYGTFSSFTSTSFNGIDFTGGLVAGKSTPYSNYNKRIISQTGNTINFSTPATITNGICGYAIVDHLNTLDVDGEWYFNKAVDSLYLYSLTDPNSSIVEASNTNYTVFIASFSNLIFKGLRFTKGENNSNTAFVASVYINGCTNIEFNSCEFLYTPRNVIRINLGNGNKILNCNFYQNDGTCIATDGSKNTEIRNCRVVRNNLDFTKAAKGLNGVTTFDFRRDTSLLCTENYIDSSAYNGIYMKSQTNSIISKNVVKHWNLLFMDGGAIYTHYEHNNLLIDQNLLYDANTGGNEAFTIVNNTWAYQTRGLYLDGSTNGVTVSNNTFALTGDLAATFGDMQNCKLLNNTIFQNNVNKPLCRYYEVKDSANVTGSQIPYNPSYTTTFKNNIFAHANSLHQAFLNFNSAYLNQMRFSDSNFYVTPFQVYNNLSKQDTAYNVKSWAAKFNFDKNSHAAPVYISTSTYPLTERISNGNFTTNVNGWTLQGGVTYAPNMLDSGCLRMNVTTAQTTFYTSVGPITAGKKYELSFTCYATDNMNSSLQCRIRNGSALPTIGSVISNTAPLPYYFHKNYRNTISMVFTATASSTNGLIAINAPNPPTTDSIVFIDNVSFKEISTEVNKDSLVRFEVNETSSPKVIDLSGIQYVDPKWNYYNGTATVAPYSSIILINSPVSPIVNGKVYPYNEVGICVGSTLSFSPTSSQSGGSWLWSGPNNFSSNLRNPQITNLQVTHAGQYKLNYTNSSGIVYTYYFDVSVNINPLSAPVLVLNNGVLASSVASSASYIWYLNNNYLDSSTQNTLTPLLNGSYTVKTYFNGCYSPTSNTVIKTVSIIAASKDASLSALTTSAGSITPTFTPATFAYTKSVANAISSVTVTPTVNQADATVTIFGETVASGAASNVLPLIVGINTIPITVTAQDDSTTKTYTLTIIREASNDATLSALTTTTGSITPIFASSTITYTMVVPYHTTNIDISPIVNQENATVKVNGVTVNSGSANVGFPTGVNSTLVTVLVTAQDGTTKTYSLTVNREPSNDATLSALITTAGSMTPTFSASTIAYTASVPTATTSINVTPIVTQTDASVTVNGVSVTSGSTSSALPLVIGSNLIIIVVTAQDGVSIKTYTLTVTRVAGIANYIWTGNVSSDWNDAANWSNSVLPSKSSSVTIPSVANSPVLSESIALTDINIVNGATLSLNGYDLYVSGNVTGTGKFKGSSTSSLYMYSGNNNTIYFESATASDSLLENLSIYGTGTITLGSGVGITDILNVYNGKLITNNHLTLKSTSIANSAVVDKVGGIIEGNVTVERYIPQGLRWYRDIGSSVANAGSFYKNWQESGNNSNGYGIHITGSKGKSKGIDPVTGLDYTNTGYHSLFKFSNNRWDSILNTKTTNLDPYQGYRVFVRGNRSINLFVNTGTTSLLTPVILRNTGELVQGNVTFTPSGIQGIFSSSYGLTNGVGAYSFLANPYACPIDWNSIYSSSSNVTPSYWYADPTFLSGGYTTYVTYNAYSQTSSNPSNSQIGQYIQSGQAFFIQNDESELTPQLVITENDKVPTASKTAIFGTTSLNRIIIGLDKANKNVDGAVAVFATNFTNVIGKEDSRKFSNSGENISLVADNTDLSIDGLALPSSNVTIPIHLYNLKSATIYQLNVDMTDFAANGMNAYLKDDMLYTQTLLTGNSAYTFATTTDTTSYNSRFSIVFRATTLPIQSITLGAIFQASSKSVKLDWLVKGTLQEVTYVVEHSTDGKTFQKQAIIESSKSTNLHYTNKKLVEGNNFYRIKAILGNGEKLFSNTTSILYNDGSQFSVFPSPVKQGVNIKLHLHNLPIDTYTAILSNSLGQEISRKSIQNQGSNVIEVISTATLSTGVYTITLTSGTGIKIIKQVVIK